MWDANLVSNELKTTSLALRSNDSPGLCKINSLSSQDKEIY